MSAELIGILSVGVALAALLLTSVKGVREELRGVEQRLTDRMQRVESRMDSLEKHLDTFEHRLDALLQRMARLEGVLDGLREALFGRTREASG
jgi:chromosome segregation ATPase